VEHKLADFFALRSGGPDIARAVGEPTETGSACQDDICGGGLPSPATCSRATPAVRAGVDYYPDQVRGGLLLSSTIISCVTPKSRLARSCMVIDQLASRIIIEPEKNRGRAGRGYALRRVTPDARDSGQRREAPSVEQSV
jgi:hypothetical protein